MRGVSIVPAVFAACIVANFLLSPCCASPPTGEEAKAKHQFTPHGQLVDEMKDGEAFIHNMHKEADLLQDYTLVFETKTFKKHETVVEGGKLYFKKPKLMRLEETGEFNKGSVAVIGKDGKARAHSGGVTSFLTVTMSPDDKMLNAANGDRMEDSDFVSLATSLKDHLKRGNQSRVTEKPIQVEGFLEPVFVLEVFHPSDPKLVTKRIYVDPKTHLPIRWDDYDYKDPCLSIWKNVKTNVGLSDDLFKL